MKDELELSGKMPPPQVAIELEEAVPTDKETEAAMLELGMCRINSQVLQAFSKIGHKIEGNGVIRTQRGAAFVSQHRLNLAIEEVFKLLIPNDPKDKLTPEQVCAITHALAYATDKLTAVQQLIISCEPKVREFVPPPEVRNTPFPAAAAVVAQSGSTVHLHQAPEKSVAEPKTPA